MDFETDDFYEPEPHDSSDNSPKLEDAVKKALVWGVSEGKGWIGGKKTKYISFVTELNASDAAGLTTDIFKMINVNMVLIGFYNAKDETNNLFGYDKKGNEVMLAKIKGKYNSLVQIPIQKLILEDGVKNTPVSLESVSMALKSYNKAELLEKIPFERKILELGYEKRNFDGTDYYVFQASNGEGKVKTLDGEIINDEAIITGFGLKLPEKEDKTINRPVNITPKKETKQTNLEVGKYRELIEKAPGMSRRRMLFWTGAFTGALGFAGWAAFTKTGQKSLDDFVNWLDSTFASSENKDLGEFYKARGNAVGYVNEGNLTIAYVPGDRMAEGMISKNSLVYGKQISNDVFRIDKAREGKEILFEDATSAIQKLSYDYGMFVPAEASEFDFRNKNTWEDRKEDLIVLHGITGVQSTDEGIVPLLKLGNNYVRLNYDSMPDAELIKLDFAQETGKEISFYGRIGQTEPWAERKHTQTMFELNVAGITFK